MSGGVVGDGSAGDGHGHAPVTPPGCTTGVEVTTGIHWYCGVTLDFDVGDVFLMFLVRWGESVVVLGHGSLGYVDGYLVGHARVFAHPERLDMGVMVEV